MTCIYIMYIVKNNKVNNHIFTTQLNKALPLPLKPFMPFSPAVI